MSETLVAPEPGTAIKFPSAYGEWLRATEDLLRPLAQLMRPGAADLPITGQVSNHDAQADRLETFARPCLLAGHWLAAQPDGAETLSREEISGWFRRGLVIGTDPKSPQYWGPTANYHQHTVEMGALVLSLEKARPWLWDPLDRREKDQVARWLGSVRGVGLHRNNHMFFGVIPLSFLLKEGYGHRADRSCIMHWMDIMEGMSLGGGWFVDGMNESIDHYNAYAFHYYGLWWGLLYGEMDPARARRWREWTHEFLKDYVYFFAASGEPVPFGRSMTYRFAASAPFALAEKCGASPLAPGLSRRLCTRNLRFFTEQNIRQSQGVLSLGWVDEFPAMTEAYSCAGSTYWAAKGLSPLLLPPEHAFWTEPEEPLPSEQGDYSHAIPQIGMVIRSQGGAVELITTATSICGGNTAFGPFKWGKLSYRTGVGFEVKPAESPYPLDASLTAESREGKLYGRQSTHPADVECGRAGCIYALGEKTGQFNVQVESHLWWKEGWQLHLHRYSAWQPARLILGGYSLAAKSPGTLREEGTYPFVRAKNGTHQVGLQALHGFEGAGRRLTLGKEKPRVHIFAENSLSLFLQTSWVEGDGWLAALVYAGPAASQPRPWTVIESVPGCLVLGGEGDPWTIEHESLPALS